MKYSLTACALAFSGTLATSAFADIPPPPRDDCAEGSEPVSDYCQATECKNDTDCPAKDIWVVAPKSDAGGSGLSIFGSDHQTVHATFACKQAPLCVGSETVERGRH